MSRLLIPLLVVLTALPTAAQPAAPDAQALLEVERLGQALYAYDRAIAVAETAVLALAEVEDPSELIALGRFVAVPTEDGWSVAFGHYDEEVDDFIVAIQATVNPGFAVTHVEILDHPEARGSAYRDAARGIRAAVERFEFRGGAYHFAVAPTGEGDLFVYVLPAQTEPGHYPLGGDARYRFDPASRTITEEVVLHESLQMMVSEVDGELVSGTFSLALNRLLPAETAVFLAMHRQPAIPHYVLAGDWVFAIDPNGLIQPIPATDFGMDD
jgi:hypothetical protein